MNPNEGGTLEAKKMGLLGLLLGQQVPLLLGLLLGQVFFSLCLASLGLLLVFFLATHHPTHLANLPRATPSALCGPCSPSALCGPYTLSEII
jgi:hypothetical protein